MAASGALPTTAAEKAAERVRAVHAHPRGAELPRPDVVREPLRSALSTGRPGWLLPPRSPRRLPDLDRQEYAHDRDPETDHDQDDRDSERRRIRLTASDPDVERLADVVGVRVVDRSFYDTRPWPSTRLPPDTQLAVHWSVE